MESQLIILSTVEEYMRKLPDNELEKVEAALHALRHRAFKNISVKQLKDRIRELRVLAHRFVFFEIAPRIYVITAFRKGSAKTPVRYIKSAEKIYKDIQNYETY